MRGNAYVLAGVSMSRSRVIGILFFTVVPKIPLESTLESR